MSILSSYEPKPVLHYFEELCSIPHGSYHTKEISDYIVAFAKAHELRYLQDSANNVILFQPGTLGYEHSAPVIIQGHLDMVCEKEPDCDIDFLTEGLRLEVKEGYISAAGTTLGGDDGIAVAYALALLDAKDLPHPPLEVVLTTDEEVGMLGAAALDCSPLKGRTMLNLDSEDEGILLVSCAGGMMADCCLPLERKQAEGLSVTFSVTGLTGGHSGGEIHKGRANSNRLMGRVLNELGKVVSYHLISVAGGLKDNAIPRSTVAELLVRPEDQKIIADFTALWQQVLSHEFAATDPELKLTADFGGVDSAAVLSPISQRNAVALLVNLPGGVQRMSSDIEGLVQTSLNMGILTTSDTEIHAIFSVRSSVRTEKEALLAQLQNLTALLGGSVSVEGDYPAWEYQKDSPLRELMIQVFEEQYGRKPEVMAIHAGLECGLFSGKLPGLDCVSFGPDMNDIHTTKERLNIESVRRTWEYTCEVLKRLK